jgi:hypothetical protein
MLAWMRAGKAFRRVCIFIRPGVRGWYRLDVIRWSSSRCWPHRGEFLREQICAVGMPRACRELG